MGPNGFLLNSVMPLEDENFLRRCSGKIYSFQ